VTIRCPYCPARFSSLKAVRCHVTMLRKNAKNYHNGERSAPRTAAEVASAVVAANSRVTP
jgi:hypothetical protein